MISSSLTALSTFLALASAAPTLNSRSTTFCPGQAHLVPAMQCSSGFIGCVDSTLASTVCTGPKRFFNDCSGGAGLGSFFNCANGFKGCSTNAAICDIRPELSLSSRQTAPGTCAEGEGTWYVCANGFKGCSTDPFVCDPKTSTILETAPGTGSWTPAPAPGTCAEGEGSWYVCSNGFKGCSTNPFVCDPAHHSPRSLTPGTCAEGEGTWYVCANGFKGCSTNPFVCDPPSVSASTSPSSPSSSSPSSSILYCPPGQAYVKPELCPSGFVGCTGVFGNCGGEKRFWGTCPPEHGNYYNCANGFVGCSTDVSICDKKNF